MSDAIKTVTSAMTCVQAKCKKEQNASIKFSSALLDQMWSHAAKAYKFQGYVQSLQRTGSNDPNIKELQAKLEKQLEKYKNKLVGVSHDLIYSPDPSAFHKCMASQCRPEFEKMVSMVRAASKTANQNNGVPLNSMTSNRIVNYYHRKYFQKQKDELLDESTP